MDDRFIKLALDAGLLNYVDHETPRHYFINGHANLEDVAKFAKLVILETRQEAADEIERLREEHEIVSRIVDGMTLQFVERGKEIERLREVRDILQAINGAKDKEIAILRAEKHLAALKEGE